MKFSQFVLALELHLLAQRALSFLLLEVASPLNSHIITVPLCTHTVVRMPLSMTIDKQHPNPDLHFSASDTIRSTFNSRWSVYNPQLSK